MFSPSRAQVREFFTGVWNKFKNNTELTALEQIALRWILEHSEYFELLGQSDARTAEFIPRQNQENPFLHLSMHLAVAEQISIDHPPGIRRTYEKVSDRIGAHDAAHRFMDCLGEVIWESQRLGIPLNNDAYIKLIQERVSKILPL